MTYSKKVVFNMKPLTDNKPIGLVKQYTQKGYHVEKTLNNGPELWDVAVKLGIKL